MAETQARGIRKENENGCFERIMTKPTRKGEKEKDKGNRISGSPRIVYKAVMILGQGNMCGVIETRNCKSIDPSCREMAEKVVN